MSALVKEVAEALALYGRLLCTPTITHEADGPLVLTVTVEPTQQLVPHPYGPVAALAHELQYVADIATMRALCERYGIESEKLEALLPPKE